MSGFTKHPPCQPTAHLQALTSDTLRHSNRYTFVLSRDTPPPDVRQLLRLAEPRSGPRVCDPGATVNYTFRNPPPLLYPPPSLMFKRIIVLALCAASTIGVRAQPAKLQLQPGDHIAILGHALADRMQHSGYLEALIVAKHPDLNLVIRNLAASGDEVATWQRSENFGTRDQWLARVQADVIFAFYGFNESFKGYEGLEKFKADLDQFLKDAAAKNYSGKKSARIVLFSDRKSTR